MKNEVRDMTDIGGVNNKSIFDELGVSKKQEQSSTEGLGQSEFFELMVAQMKNQDPLKPETNGDFLAQLAQFRTSDGIAEMQKSMDTLSSSMQSNQALQASALVGRTVLVPGDQASLKEGGSISGVAELAASAHNINLDVFSEAGVLVKRVPMGSQVAGDLKFSWDGTDQQNQAVPAGKYRVMVTGNTGTQNLQFGTHIAANVDSVTLGNNGQGMKLNVDGVGQLNLSDIKEISE
jgi:flagellar basal-body rod modification protein FlgD